MSDSILVLGSYRQSLTVLRLLRAQGYHTIFGEAGERSYISYSRSISVRWRHPSFTLAQGEAFLELCGALLKKTPTLRAIFPVGDAEILFLSKYRARIPESVKLILPSTSTLESCFKKECFLELCQKLEIPGVPSTVVSNRTELDDAAARLGYVCVVKATDPFERVNGKKAVISHDRESFEAAFEEWPAGTRLLLVQGFAAGVRHNLDFIACHGELVELVENRVLRTNTPDGTGNATSSVTVARSPELEEYTRRIVGALGYHGVGCLQFLVNPGDGKASVLELNPRLGAHFAVTVAAGSKLPVSTVELFLGKNTPVPKNGLPEYQAGKRCSWFFGDFIGILGGVLRGELQWGVASRWFAQGIATFLVADIHGTWSAVDPLPTTMMYCTILFAPLRSWNPFRNIQVD